MAYSFQTFSVNQIFTSSQANQIEVNVRDHAHGAAGVGQTVGAAPTSSGHYANRGYVDNFLKGQVVNGLRVLFGRVDTNSNGTPSSGVIVGSGFAIGSYEAVGRILITFTTSFPTVPICLATGVSSTDLSFRDDISATTATGGQVRLNRASWGGGTYAGRDGYVDFCIIGIGYS